ncbi:unnamed protein product [Closterium sp. NIES-54]
MATWGAYDDPLSYVSQSVLPTPCAFPFPLSAHFPLPLLRARFPSLSALDAPLAQWLELHGDFGGCDDPALLQDPSRSPLSAHFPLLPPHRARTYPPPSLPRTLSLPLSSLPQWVELHGNRGGYDDPALLHLTLRPPLPANFPPFPLLLLPSVWSCTATAAATTTRYNLSLRSPLSAHSPLTFSPRASPHSLPPPHSPPFPQWVELHGDRGGYDDPALVCGIGRMDGMSFMFMGHQKGRNTKENIYRNFGMPTPNGYRKALRMMRHADHHGLPIITFVDTPGAYAGVTAEELGQGEAIAHNLREMFGLKVPSVSVVIGEGGSGGALAIGCCNKMLMLENAVYFVASPEACAAILWKTAAAAPKATEALRITADQLQQLGVVDEIIPEPLGGAHNDHMATSMAIKSAIMAHMKDLVAKDEQRIICERVGKFRQMGGFTVPPKVDPAKQRALKKRDRPAGQSVPASPSPSRSASLPSWGSQPPAAPADNGNGATYPSSVVSADANARS